MLSSQDSLSEEDLKAKKFLNRVLLWSC